MEKDYLLLNALERCGVKAHALGFCHSESNRRYFEKTYAKGALYSYSFGSKRALYQGGNYIEKLYSNLYLFFWFSARLYKFLRARPTSAIIIPPNPLELTLPVMVLGKLFGVCVVPNIMEYEPALPSFHRKKSIFSRWSWALVTKFSDAYIVISGFLEDKMRQLSRKPSFRLPAMLPPQTDDIRSDVPDCAHTTSGAPAGGVPLLIFTSSQAYADLLGFCIDALSRLHDRNFHLVITGEYSVNARNLWMTKAGELGLEGKISFSGFLSDEEMRTLQIRSTALLMPLLDNDRHRARFPQKILGYMRLGKPVITTKVGELDEYFRDTDTVLMDESVTAQGYSEKIRFLLDHPDHAADIGIRGSRYVESRFNELVLGKQLAGFLAGLGA
ncbi:hypothetical protein SCL_1607 [Sulfuricaulis limicola]|uniref:Glycosyl transferase family 1 domain-containing protein n=2 Tax=Sulfuricaulis limicola TaxID=1620215 RepID=A0A1B4XGH6_9GAMM|nr:hypothetical protein SCL_1607 [Sulfuricaulis limicola]